MGNKLQEKRRAAGLSQAQLAGKAGMSVRTLQHYEQGMLDFNRAAAVTVWRVAHALDCPVEDLLDIEAELELLEV